MIEQYHGHEKVVGGHVRENIARCLENLVVGNEDDDGLTYELYVVGAEVGYPEIIEETYTPDDTNESSYGVKLTIRLTVEVWLADTPA